MIRGQMQIALITYLFPCTQSFCFVFGIAPFASIEDSVSYVLYTFVSVRHRDQTNFPVFFSIALNTQDVRSSRDVVYFRVGAEQCEQFSRLNFSSV